MNEVITQNGAKSIFTNNNVNSFQTKEHEVRQSKSSVLTSTSNHVKPDSHLRILKDPSRVLTLQQYRKVFNDGLKVTTQKPNSQDSELQVG